MALTGVSFKKQKWTLARKQNRTLFRKQTSTLYRKQSWMLFWKKNIYVILDAIKDAIEEAKKDVS